MFVIKCDWIVGLMEQFEVSYLYVCCSEDGQYCYVYEYCFLQVVFVWQFVYDQ